MSRIVVLSASDLGAALLSPDAYTDLAYDKATVTARYWAPDTIKVVFGGAARGASSVVKKALLWMPDDGDALFLVEQVETHKTGSSRANAEVTATGRAIEGIATQERLVIPAALADYDAQTAVVAETAIKHYVTGQAGSGAAAARQIANLNVVGTSGRGSGVTVQARYQPVQDILLQIGLLSGMGWGTSLNRATGKVDFDVIVGTDRQASVFFDFDFGTVTEWQDVDSILTSKTVAVVGGQGDLAARDVETRWSGSEPTGLDRREGFVDARDVAAGNLSLLDARGDAFLGANGGTRTNEATISQFGSFQPGVDWYLGDVVLLRDAQAGVNEAARVVELERTWAQSAAVPTVKAVVGKPFQTIDSVIGGGFGPTGSQVDLGQTAVEVASTVAAAAAALSAGGANLVTNSSFESDVTGNWTVGSNWTAPYVAAGAFRGANSARAQLAAQTAGELVTTGFIPVVRTDDYWVSFWSFLSAYTSGTARCAIREYDAGGGLLATTLVDTAAAESDWTRHPKHFGPDASTPDRVAFNASTTKIKIAFYTPAAATLTWRVDAVQVERGKIITAYAPSPQELVDAQVGTTQIADDAITTPKLVAASVVAGKVAAGALTADTFAATLVLASLIKTAISGARVELDAAGFRAYGSSGDLLVNIPTTGAPVYVNAVLEALSLSVTGNAVFQGPANEIAQAAVLQLDSKQGNPSQAPSLAANWGTPLVPAAPALTGWNSVGGYYDSAGGAGGATACFVAIVNDDPTFHVYEWKLSDGTLDRDTVLAVPAGFKGFQQCYVTRIGASWYVTALNAAGNSCLYKFARSDGSLTSGPTVISGDFGGSLNNASGIVTDGTSLYVQGNDVGSDQARVAKYNTSLVYQSAVVLTKGAGAYAAGSLAYADIGAGGLFYAAFYVGGAYTNWYSFALTGGAQIANTEFPVVTALASAWPNLFWDGTNFRGTKTSSDSAARAIYTHTNWTWTTASALYWVAYAWYDSNATGGTHESVIGPRQSITMGRRQVLTITSQDVPGGTGTDYADSVRFYMKPNATDPGSTALKLQSTGSASTVSLTDYASGGAADSATNTFPGGTPGEVRSQAGEWYLRGDGVALFNALRIDDLAIGGTDIHAKRSAAKTLRIDTDGAGGALTAVDITAPLTGDAAYFLHAENNLTGGGNITWAGTDRILWSDRFIVIGSGLLAGGPTDGYYDITCPTSGTITGVGGHANVTATAAGILMGPWDTLWYILPPDTGHASATANFRIAAYSGAFVAPSNWVRIATYNGDAMGGGVMYFGNGMILNRFGSRDMQAAPRYVAVNPITMLNTTTAASIGATLLEVTGIPTTGVVAVELRIYISSTVANAGNWMGVGSYANTTAQDFYAWGGSVAGYNTGSSNGRVATGGTNNRQIQYMVNRAAGTITYVLAVYGYWTTL